MQTGSTRSCHHCDASDLELNHNATYLTDFHTDEEPTWWQSQSMFYGVQYPNSINITLHLGKSPLLSFKIDETVGNGMCKNKMCTEICELKLIKIVFGN